MKYILAVILWMLATIAVEAGSTPNAEKKIAWLITSENMVVVENMLRLQYEASNAAGFGMIDPRVISEALEENPQDPFLLGRIVGADYVIVGDLSVLSWNREDLIGPKARAEAKFNPTVYDISTGQTVPITESLTLQTKASTNLLTAVGYLVSSMLDTTSLEMSAYNRSYDSNGGGYSVNTAQVIGWLSQIPLYVIRGNEQREIVKATERVLIQVAEETKKTPSLSTIVKVENLPQTGYHWLPDGRILLLCPGEDNPEYWAYTLDPATGRKKALFNFNQAVNGTLKGISSTLSDSEDNVISQRYIPPAVSLSPDGEWLVWSGRYIGDRDRSNQGTLARLDGDTVLHWADEYGPSGVGPYFYPDAHQFVYLNQTPDEQGFTVSEISIFAVDEPVKKLKQISLKNACGGSPVGITPEGILVLKPFVFTNDHSFSLCRIDLNDPANIQSQDVALPIIAWVTAISLSPDGNKLGWMLGETQYGAPEDHTFSFWVSDIEGTGFKKIGQKVMRMGELQQDPLLRWTAGGDGLSMIFGNTLYLAEIN